MGSLIARKKAIMMMQMKSGLPSEYQEVEYISTAEFGVSSNPTMTFICTGIQYTQITKIMCKYEVIEWRGSNRPMYIASHSLGSTTPNTPYATLKTQSGFDSASPYHSAPYTGFVDTYTIMVKSTNSNYMRIGGWSDMEWTAHGYYYFVEAFNQDVKVASFIPCYRKSDGKAGMYEIIGGNFYTSNGTKDFIAGPDV